MFVSSERHVKRITTRLVGGLGNQLCCYAFGRAIAAFSGAKLELDTESGYWSDHYGRRYMLSAFPELNIRKRRFRSFPASRLLFKVRLKLASLLSRRLPRERKLVIKEGLRCAYQPEIHHTIYKNNPYFIGYWASYRYYSGIEDQLRLELTPPKPQAPEALKALVEIESTNSCLVHWRSYFEEIEKGIVHPDMRDYYAKAMQCVEDRFPDVRFFVFSDRSDLLRDAVDVEKENVSVIELTSLDGDARSLADFYLMYRCKHAIIGDSTFSWWAAWLSDGPDKLVVGPEGLSPWGSDWMPPHWTAINAVARRADRD